MRWEDYQIRATASAPRLPVAQAFSGSRKPDAGSPTAAWPAAAGRARVAPPAWPELDSSVSASSSQPASSVVRYHLQQSSSAESPESPPAPSSSPPATAQSQPLWQTTKFQSAAPTAYGRPQTCSDHSRAPENRPSIRKLPLPQPHFPARH